MAKFNFKKILMMGMAAIMAISAMSVTVFAQYTVDTDTDVIAENSVFVPADAEVGTIYDLGDGVYYKVVSQEEYNELADMVESMQKLRSTKYNWSLSNLNGTKYDQYFDVTSSYPYWHVAMCNNQTSGTTLMAVFDPDGDLVKSVEVDGGGSSGSLGWIYSTSAFDAGEYMVRFSSTRSMSGSAYGFSASKASDVVFEG